MVSSLLDSAVIYRIVFKSSRISCETLSHLPEVAHHLLYQRAHGSHIDNLELIRVDGAISIDVLAYLSHHSEQSYVRLTSTLHTEGNHNVFACFSTDKVIMEFKTPWKISCYIKKLLRQEGSA